AADPQTFDRPDGSAIGEDRGIVAETGANRRGIAGNAPSIGNGEGVVGSVKAHVEAENLEMRTRSRDRDRVVMCGIVVADDAEGRGDTATGFDGQTVVTAFISDIQPLSNPGGPGPGDLYVVVIAGAIRADEHFPTQECRAGLYPQVIVV